MDVDDLTFKVTEVTVSKESVGQMGRTKMFSSRQVYLDLEKEQLTDLPNVQGVLLSCHTASMQWHGAYPKETGSKLINRAPKWGEGLRTERQALLLALLFVWQTHHSRTKEGADQVARLKAALQQ